MKLCVSEGVTVDCLSIITTVWLFFAIAVCLRLMSCMLSAYDKTAQEGLISSCATQTAASI